MIKGIYSSASAMIPRIRQQEVIANNIANVTTPGFKKDSVFVSELSSAQRRGIATKSDWETPMIDQVYTDQSQGSFDKTGNMLDLAIDGDGFFVIQNEDGTEALTRNGSFTTNDSGSLVNSFGETVMGTGGPIQLPAGDVSVSGDGIISVNGVQLTTLKIASVENPAQLNKVGGKFFIPEGIELTTAVNFAVRQGYLESSNVDIITQMVEMISSYRNYESDAQALKAQDESLEKLIREVAQPI